MFKRTWFGALMIMSAALWTAPLLSQPYLDPQAPVQVRVDDLLSRMTLAEKIGQMTQADRGGLAHESDIATFYLGSVLSGGGSAPQENSPSGWADLCDRFQSVALSTRLAIPLLYGIDAVHGHNNVKGAVIFPHNIGLGATRNPELVQKAAEITRLEVAATGINWTFAPCVAVPQDERWGRTYEAFAEKPELVAQLADAVVRGLQTDSLGQANSILACAKHYLADGGTSGGDDQGNALLDETELRRLHLPGYIAAIKAGVGSIMPSFSSWNGAKMHGNYYLLTSVLKTELGFQGFLISDWEAIKQLPGDNYRTKVKTAINAGVDMAMEPSEFRTFISALTGLVQSGDVAMSRIDDAVRRILYIKLEMGLFERHAADRALTSQVGNEAHREIARACVRQSLVVLFKKDGVLPLSHNAKRIHVTGNGADDLGVQCGGWTISWQGASGAITNGTTILQALRAEAPQVQFTYSPDGSGAAGADLAVVILAETPYAEGEGDREDLHFTAEVVAPLRNLKKAGLKTVVVLLSGRPMIIDSILPYSDALIAAWLPGTEGRGISDVLFGRHQPSGKLPHSWPRAMADIPINDGQTPYAPLYPYGYGLTSLEDSAPGSAPMVAAASVDNRGDALLISMNKAMADPAAGAADWRVRVNGNAVKVMAAKVLKGDRSTIRLRLQQSVRKQDQVMVGYQGGSLRSRDHGVLAGFSQPVYNGLQQEH
jgi:beta-glucosidase